MPSKQPAEHVLTIDQAAQILGEFPKSLRKMIAAGTFPAADATVPLPGQGEFPGWTLGTLERWRDLRDRQPAPVPRFECGPFADRDRCGPTQRLLQHHGFRSRVGFAIEGDKFEYFVAVPVTRETAARIGADLKELFPRLPFTLIDEPAWLDA